MFLKNYTSDVPVSQTIYRIEQVLIKCGASGITKEYLNTNGDIGSIKFTIETPSGPATINLPADTKKAVDALWLDYADGDKLNDKGDGFAYYSSRKKKTRKDFVEQGARTAWKIMQDWVEVQMSMIQLKQAEPLQVFLPYVMCGGETVYQRIQSGGLKRLTMGDGA